MHNLRLVVILLLAANAAFFAFLCIPDLMSAQIIGFRGHYESKQFSVTTVYQGSPADAAGLQPGDTITKQDGRDVANWYKDYHSNLDVYVAQRENLVGQTIHYDISQADQARTLDITPRDLGFIDAIRLYGIRLVLVTLLAALTIVVLISRTRERGAFLIMLTFSFAILWLVADIPDWSVFFAPVLFSPPGMLIYIKKIIEILFLQLAIASLFHVVLVFPKRHLLLEKYPWLLLVNYIGPLFILVMIMFASNGGILNRLATVHDPRLWMNTFIMIAATAIMIISYRTLPSPSDREQIRWIVVALFMFVAIHLALWNIPKLLLGYPLVPGYEWVLLPGTFIPITMTMAIINHELFGIRGIIRGRIMLLETLLEREKSLVVNRDRHILGMTRELGALKDSLEQYRRAELGDVHVHPSPLLSRLQERYPEIEDIRRERLLGASPRWEQIFERAIVAARGITPVMVVGESGTGKTNLALAIHQLSDQKDKTYKEISCAQFEHADPAFALGRLFGIGTGHGLPNAPKEGRKGLLEECDNGTLFLDDFDRLPLSVQDMLLHPLEGRPFEPGIGIGPACTVSIKFILATNREPTQLVKEGSFRGDVLARIGERVDIPPLRERLEDIPVLVEHFLKSVCQELGHEITIVSPMTMNLLKRYPYASGNARELQMEIRTAVGKAMLEEDQVLRAGYLSTRLRAEHVVSGEKYPSASASSAETTTDAVVEIATTLAVLKKHQFQIKVAEAELGYSHKSKTLSNHLRGICIEAMSKHGWDARSAAVSLSGDNLPTVAAKLQRKMERYAKNVESNVAQHTESNLYKNLPAPYHDALNRMIDYLRSGTAR